MAARSAWFLSHDTQSPIQIRIAFHPATWSPAAGRCRLRWCVGCRGWAVVKCPSWAARPHQVRGCCCGPCLLTVPFKNALLGHLIVTFACQYRRAAYIILWIMLSSGTWLLHWRVFSAQHTQRSSHAHQCEGAHVTQWDSAHQCTTPMHHQTIFVMHHAPPCRRPP